MQSKLQSSYEDSDFSIENSLAHAADRVEQKLIRKSTLYKRYGKRIFDIIFVVLCLPFVLPLIGILYCFIVMKGANAFFSHRRVGKGGQYFYCHKFRTMFIDSEARLQKILKEDTEAARSWAKNFKLRNDPRVTPIGRLLRKTSLDELPQLWNILRGEMSLVGPRPVTQEELLLYADNVNAYLSVRPGLTGLWQVSGRNDTSYDERTELDRQYVDKLSLLEDLRIMLRTVPALLRLTGC